MTEASVAALMAQLAALNERVEGMREDIKALETQVETVHDLLTRARGATWMLGAIAAIAGAAHAILNWDAIKGLLK